METYKVKHRLFSALAFALARLLSVAGLSEKPSETDLYAREIYEAYGIEAPVADAVQ